MGHCRLHGHYEEYCRDCLLAQENLEEQIGDLTSEVSKQADLINNPGEYECPYCLFKTLNYMATVCFKCHRDIDNNYWINVDNKEARKREARLKKAKEEAAIKATVEKAQLDAQIAAQRKEKEWEREMLIRVYVYGILAVLLLWVLFLWPTRLSPPVHRQSQGLSQEQPSTKSGNQAHTPASESVPE